ncbi:MAG: thiamine diphosphokinase [Treponema sp.]|nr:thiamine diphosphokinase [Treponema sp.]
MSDYNFLKPKKSIHITIFTGGAYPDPSVTTRYWQTHIPEYIIAADSGLDTIRHYTDFYADRIDFTPQKILGDFDSVSDKDLLTQYPADIEERFPPDKDWTDTELAFDSAYKIAEKKLAVPFITLVGGDGGRLDHLIAIYDTFSSVHHAQAWLLSSQVLYYIAAETTVEISRLTRGETVSVARTSVSRTGGTLVSHGLKWESNVFRAEGMPSVSNRISDEYAKSGKPVTISAYGMPALLIVPYTAEVRFLLKEN